MFWVFFVLMSCFHELEHAADIINLCFSLYFIKIILNRNVCLHFADLQQSPMHNVPTKTDANLIISRGTLNSIGFVNQN